MEMGSEINPIYLKVVCAKMKNVKSSGIIAFDGVHLRQGLVWKLNTIIGFVDDSIKLETNVDKYKYPKELY
jgi:hypothetical protein